MADFRGLVVYQKAKTFNTEVYSYVKESRLLDRTYKDQLSRAALSIGLNIAEGSGRFSPKDQRYFFTIARGSALECLAIFDLISCVFALFRFWVGFFPLWPACMRYIAIVFTPFLIQR